MACAILERTSGFEPSSQTNCSMIFEAFYSSKLLSFYLDLTLDAISAVCH